MRFPSLASRRAVRRGAESRTEMIRRKTALAMVMTASLHFAASVQAAELSAGVARIDLTPPQEFSAALGGYGERMSRPAEGVHDHVNAKALVISNGQRRFAVLTADILGFPPAFKPALLGQLASDGWTAEQLMLLPSHSHTSIEMNAINPANTFAIKQVGVYDERLFQWTLRQCRQVIEQASRELQPVSVATASKALPGWNRNRRRGEDVTDDRLTVTRIDALDGMPLAVLVNFTAHPTFMGAEHMLFSGGWPGHLQRSLERMIGRDANVLYYNGAEGDQAPVSREPAAADRWEAAENFGRGLAAESLALWETITPLRDVAFQFHCQAIDLPPKSWHPQFMTTGGEEYGLSEDLLREMLPAMFPERTTVCCLRLGELLIVGVPGEMAAGLGLEIKEQANAITGVQHIAIGGLANEWVSYILTGEQYQRGGYEASVSFYGPSLGQCVVAGAIKAVRAMKQ